MQKYEHNGRDAYDNWELLRLLFVGEEEEEARGACGAKAPSLPVVLPPVDILTWISNYNDVRERGGAMKKQSVSSKREREKKISSPSSSPQILFDKRCRFLIA